MILSERIVVITRLAVGDARVGLQTLQIQRIKRRCAYAAHARGECMNEASGIKHRTAQDDGVSLREVGVDERKLIGYDSHNFGAAIC
jgi:hypothetical protein